MSVSLHMPDPPRPRNLPARALLASSRGRPSRAHLLVNGPEEGVEQPQGRQLLLLPRLGLGLPQRPQVLGRRRPAELRCRAACGPSPPEGRSLGWGEGSLDTASPQAEPRETPWMGTWQCPLPLQPLPP